MEYVPAGQYEQPADPGTVKNIRDELAFVAGIARVMKRRVRSGEERPLPKAYKDIRSEVDGDWITGSVRWMPNGTRRDRQLLGVVVLQRASTIGVSERFELRRLDDSFYYLEKFESLENGGDAALVKRSAATLEELWELHDQEEKDFFAQEGARQELRAAGLAEANTADAQFLLAALTLAVEAPRGQISY